MPSFKKFGQGNSNKKYGKKDFGKPSFGGKKSRKAATLHETVCSECGDPCKVPFKPFENKPVFCDKCFKKEGGSSSNKSFNKDYGSRSFSSDFKSKSSDISKEQFAILNAKLDRILKALEG